MRALDGGADAGLSAEAAASYRSALRRLARGNIFPADVAGLAVFRTGDPVGELRTFLDDARARPLPTPAAPPFVRTDVFPGYCVYQGHPVRMPSYQQGRPHPVPPAAAGRSAPTAAPASCATRRAASW